MNKKIRVKASPRKILLVFGVLLLGGAAWVYLSVPDGAMTTRVYSDVAITYKDGTTEKVPLLPYATIIYSGKAISTISFVSYLKVTSKPSSWNPTISFSYTISGVKSFSGTGSLTLSGGSGQVALKSFTVVESDIAGLAVPQVPYDVIVSNSVTLSATDPNGFKVSASASGAGSLTVLYDPTVYTLTASTWSAVTPASIFNAQGFVPVNLATDMSNALNLTTEQLALVLGVCGVISVIAGLLKKRR